jgi:hypothetical protein
MSELVNKPPFRFYHGARADWYFDPDDALVFAAQSTNDGSKGGEPARIVMNIPVMLDGYAQAGEMKTNATYDKKGVLLKGEQASVAIAKDDAAKEQILDHLRYDAATYIKNGNGIYGGAHLIITDTNKNETYDARIDKVEIILCGKDENYGDVIVCFEYDGTEFLPDLDHFYTWKPDGNGGGTFEKNPAPIKIGEKKTDTKPLIKN